MIPDLIPSRSVSDDDLCAFCVHLDYHQGELSACRLAGCGRDDWPSVLNSDGYCIACPRFKHEKELVKYGSLDV